MVIFPALAIFSNVDHLGCKNIHRHSETMRQIISHLTYDSFDSSVSLKSQQSLGRKLAAPATFSVSSSPGECGEQSILDHTQEWFLPFLKIAIRF